MNSYFRFLFYLSLFVAPVIFGQENHGNFLDKQLAKPNKLYKKLNLLIKMHEARLKNLQQCLQQITLKRERPMLLEQPAPSEAIVDAYEQQALHYITEALEKFQIERGNEQEMINFIAKIERSHELNHATIKQIRTLKRLIHNELFTLQNALDTIKGLEVVTKDLPRIVAIAQNFATQVELSLVKLKKLSLALMPNRPTVVPSSQGDLIL
jgi:hypothetical protein